MTDSDKPAVRELPTFEPGTSVREGKAMIVSKDGFLYVADVENGTIKRVEWGT